MAHSKLHIICGNCGADSSMMEHDICPTGKCVEVDGEIKESPATYIYCHNCSTLHTLSDFVKERGGR